MNAIGNWQAMLYTASTWVLPVIIAVTFHEAAHGFVANRFGDDTALRAGRITFNPLKHVDGFGTIILPAILILLRAPFLFGYAKPVPVDFSKLRPLRAGTVLVAAAGPGTNVLLAIGGALAFYAVQFLPGGQIPIFNDLWSLFRIDMNLLPASPAAWVAANLVNAIVINAVLCIFNMLPLPPLDGGRVLVGLLPRTLALPLARAEPYGIMILLLFLFVLPMIGSQMGIDLNLIGYVIAGPANALINFVLLVTGQGG
jgi:Zn-dependent protease